MQKTFTTVITTLVLLQPLTTAFADTTATSASSPVASAEAAEPADDSTISKPGFVADLVRIPPDVMKVICQISDSQAQKISEIDLQFSQLKKQQGSSDPSNKARLLNADAADANSQIRQVLTTEQLSQLDQSVPLLNTFHRLYALPIENLGAAEPTPSQVVQLEKLAEKVRADRVRGEADLSDKLSTEFRAGMSDILTPEQQEQVAEGPPPPAAPGQESGKN